MDGNGRKSSRWWLPSRACTGFLIVLILCVFAWSFWQIGEPSRRAMAVTQSLRAGMTPSQVLALLDGRYMHVYKIRVGDEFESCTPEEFFETLEGPPTGTEPRGILWITFLGSSPARVSIDVRFGPDGRVTEWTRPHGWD